MRSSMFATVALALSPGIFAAESGPDGFAGLFATTCMQYFYAPEKLSAEMTAQNATLLQDEPSQFFLGGMPGTAWSVQLPGGKYVVSLREDSVCAVFAQRAPVADVQANFTALVASAPEPLVAIAREPGGPNTGSLKTISYAWHRPKDKVELLFTLTTSNEAAPTVQAMASMALANKPNNSFKPNPLRRSVDP